LVRPNLQLPLAVAAFEEIFNGVQNSLAEYFLAAGGKVGILNRGQSIVLDLSDVRSALCFSKSSSSRPSEQSSEL